MSLFARIASGLALAAAFAAMPAAAQDYPNKPIKILVGFQAGGPTDTLSRIIGDYLTRTWGQPVVVEARPGAAGNVAAELTARAPADGYTLHVNSMVVFNVYPAMYEKLAYDAKKELVPIAILTRTPMVVETNLQVPVKNFQEFIGFMKRDGAKTNFGSPGVGTLPHLAAELFRIRMGLASTHIPYRGTAPFADALLKNEVQWGVDPIGTAVMQRDKLRVLAIMASERAKELPDVPTLAELGYAGMEASSAFMVTGPIGIPKPIVERIATGFGAALREPQTIERLKAVGLYPDPMTTEQTVKFLADEEAKWVPLIKANNIKAE